MQSPTPGIVAAAPIVTFLWQEGAVETQVLHVDRVRERDGLIGPLVEAEDGEGSAEPG